MKRSGLLLINKLPLKLSPSSAGFSSLGETVSLFKTRAGFDRKPIREMGPVEEEEAGDRSGDENLVGGAGCERPGEDKRRFGDKFRRFGDELRVLFGEEMIVFVGEDIGDFGTGVNVPNFTGLLWGLSRFRDDWKLVRWKR